MVQTLNLDGAPAPDTSAPARRSSAACCHRRTARRRRSRRQTPALTCTCSWCFSLATCVSARSGARQRSREPRAHPQRFRHRPSIMLARPRRRAPAAAPGVRPAAVQLFLVRRLPAGPARRRARRHVRSAEGCAERGALRRGHQVVRARPAAPPREALSRAAAATPSISSCSTPSSRWSASWTRASGTWRLRCVGGPPAARARAP